MRNELNNIEKIERYLLNAMTAEERLAFEKEMATDARLREEVKLQEEVMKGMKTISLKQEAKKAYTRYRLGKGFKKWGGIGGGIIMVTTASYFAWNYFGHHQPEREIKISYELPELNENGGKTWADADKYLPYQLFSINNSKDTVVETEDGIVVAIPAGCFLGADGKPVNGEVQLEMKEAIESDDILKSGLSTRSGDTPLETGGMFYLNARKDGESLKIDPAKGIVTQVPTDEVKPGMQVYEGKRMPDGTIDWIKPKELEKFLIPVDIHSLNFYPPDYEDTLAVMSQRADERIYKDSLYYSFADLFGEGDDSPMMSEPASGDSVKSDTSSVSLLEVNESNLSEELHFAKKCKERMDQGYLDKASYNIHFQLPKAHYLQTDYHGIQFKNEQDGLSGEKIIRSQREFDLISLFCEIHQFDCSYASNKDGSNSWPTWFSLFKSYGKKSTNKVMDGEQLFRASCASCHKPHQTLVGPALKGARQRWTDAGIRNKIYQWIQNPKKTLDEGHPYVKALLDRYNNSVLMTPQKVSREEIDAILDYVDGSMKGINPAKVKAIWHKKFNNTILATREFEERMKYIHLSCENEILDLYVNNLDKKLCTVDSMAAKLNSRFMEFVQRGDGRVQVEKAGHIEKLKKYYADKVKAYTEAAAKTKKAYLKEQQVAEEKFNEQENSHQEKEIKRAASHFKQEYEMNLKEALRQLGYPPKVPVSPVPTGTYTAVVTSPGWKNIDRATWEATASHTTLDYTDPFTGKTAKIKYEEVSITVENRQDYDVVFVYAIPSELNSFMRFAEKKNVFTEKLNELMEHEMVCVAYKGEQAYLYYQEELKPGKYDAIHLNAVSKKELNQQLAKIKQHGQEQKLLDELSFRHQEQKEKLRQEKVKDQEEFRERIRQTIFPCGEPAPAAVDTTRMAMAHE